MSILAGTVHVRPQLHPDWCDPGTCAVEPEFGEGLTHYLHSRVLLHEPPLTPGAMVNDVRVEVCRSDLRRFGDEAVVDVWGSVVEIEPAKVYVSGLFADDLTADQAGRVSEAPAQAATIVAGAR